MIEFACGSCGKQFRVADELAGRKASCKQCGSAIQIPQPAVMAAASAPSSIPLAAPSRSVPSTRKEVDLTAVINGKTAYFDYEISQRPDFAMVKVNLPEGNKIFAEPSAMMSMSPSVELKAGFKGGFKKTLGRAFGGESLIINTFTAKEGGGEVSLAPGATGDVVHYNLNGIGLMMQRGSFIMHTEGVELTGKWQGAKGFFSGEGLVLLKATGTGDIFFNSYGAILPIDVTEEFYVDSGYVVAFEESLGYKVTTMPGLRAKGMKSFFFGGEAFVCQFTGQGRVWIQTRHVHPFLSYIHPFRPAKNNN